MFWSTAILLAYLAKGLGAYFSAYLMTDIGQRVVRDLRDQLFKHIVDQSAAFFSRWSTGSLMSRLSNDVGQVQQAVSETVGDLLREGLALIGYAFLLFYWDARLALVCVTGAPLVVYPLVRLGQRVRRAVGLGLQAARGGVLVGGEDRAELGAHPVPVQQARGEQVGEVRGHGGTPPGGATGPGLAASGGASRSVGEGRTRRCRR